MGKCLMMMMVLGCAMCGCISGPGPQIQPATIENVSTFAKTRAGLKRAVITAAVGRRWVPTELSENVIRCTLIQRQHKVEIDVALESDKAYSIRCVSCNIPEAKYRQWIGNLQRDIAKGAAAAE